MPGSKLYFITDAHLGAGPDTLERERELCALLDRIKEDAAKVVFLGDMFDFWFTYKYVVPKGFVRLLGRMAAMADAGVELHFFVGNHDMWMFDYLKDEMEITMHNDPTVLEFDGKRFLVGHGDGLGHQDKRYDCLRRIFRSRLNQRLFSILPEWMTFGLATGWSSTRGIISYRYETMRLYHKRGTSGNVLEDWYGLITNYKVGDDLKQIMKNPSYGQPIDLNILGSPQWGNNFYYYILGVGYSDM